MLNKNLLLLNTTLNDYYTRPFGDVFYDESTEIPQSLSPYINDQRMLRPRLKTILEMRPDLLFDAGYGVLDNLGNIADDGDYWYEWVSRTGNFSVDTVEMGPPRWLKYGINNRPSVQFDGSDRVSYTGTLPLNGDSFTVIIRFQCQDVTAAANRIIFYVNAGIDKRYLSFGVTADGYIIIDSRDTTKLGYYTVKGSTLLGTNSHTAIFTVNQAGDTWEVYIDEEQETLTPGVNGNPGYGFSDYGPLTHMKIGGYTTRFAGQVGYIAIWNKRI